MLNDQNLKRPGAHAPLGVQCEAVSDVLGCLLRVTHTAKSIRALLGEESRAQEVLCPGTACTHDR